MEANLRPDPPHPPPPPSDRLRRPELARSKIELGKDIRRRSPVATPDDCTAWTDEKHNSYLRHLEVSFVKQLHQSKMMSELAKYSDQSQRDVNIIPQENLSSSSQQFNVLGNGCWKKNSHIRDNPRELWSTAKHGKKTISSVYATRSHESSSSDPYLGDLSDFEREGTGQNFFDQSSPKFLSRAKRSKTNLVDESSQEISSIDFC